MARRTTLIFTADDIQNLAELRYQHPDLRVQQRMEVLWLISQNENQDRAAILAGVSKATVARYIAIFRSQGVAGLKEFHWVKPTSVLEDHRVTLEEEFRQRPPHTVAEAAQRIKTLTGITRKETQVRLFLKKLSA